MKVKYIYSACIEIDCDGFKILTDPWFIDGAYDGSWYQFPKIDPFKYISKPDLVYVSHIHPDHYDPLFLKQLIKRFGEVNIVIPDLNPNYLFMKGKADQLNLIPLRHFKNEKVEIFIEENDTGSLSDIDSALIVKDLKTGQVLLNLNDCIYNPPHVEKLKQILSTMGKSLDLLALGYTGAGPYPQTYIDIENKKELLISEALHKKHSFFSRYKQYTQEFNARVHLPFAGEYILGGRLYHLNEYRGVADAFEVKKIDEKALILSSGGEIDLTTGSTTGKREAKYSSLELKKRYDEIKDKLFDYEKEIQIPLEKINFKRLLQAAAKRAQLKSELDQSYKFIFLICDSLMKPVKRFILDTQNLTVEEIAIDQDILALEYSEIKIDYRYLYGLLTATYHWNNAEVGSHFFTQRVPLKNFKPRVQSYLNFFSVC